MDGTIRFDFDEDLLPEDSWVPGEESGRYELKEISDEDLPLSASTDITQR